MFYCTALLLLAATADVFSYSITQSQEVGIAGGEPVGISRARYMADVRYNSHGRLDEPKHLCGGSILNERFILTAAHCCADKFKTYTIAVGTNNDHKGILYKVEKTIPNEKYLGINTSKFDYDICLVKLAKEITFGENVKKVELPDENFQLKAGMALNATGWGYTEYPYGIRPDVLHQVSLPLVEQRKCEKIYKDRNFNLTDRMICAGVEGKGVCQYDSGGPLVWKNKLVGITNFGIQNCSRYPSVFAKITAYLTWIKETVARNI